MQRTQRVQRTTADELHARPTGGRGSGGVDGRGIADSRLLPDDEFLALWDAIIVDQHVKERLLAYAWLNFTLRGQVPRADLPFHGILLLAGVPGTGKTSLAKGLAARAAQALSSDERTPLYLEVDPHALTSAALGKIQRAVTDLLGTTIAEQAQQHPLIVLLDEVETLAADRTKLSLEANPVDVHRATDAVLTQVDALAEVYPQVLFLATSNFPQALDAAFVSRADFVVTLEVPAPDACRAILTAAVKALAARYPALAALPADPAFTEAVSACVGLDGRQIRKVVIRACALRKETALDLERLTAHDLVVAAHLVQQEIGAIAQFATGSASLASSASTDDASNDARSPRSPLGTQGAVAPSTTRRPTRPAPALQKAIRRKEDADDTEDSEGATA